MKDFLAKDVKKGTVTFEKATASKDEDTQAKLLLQANNQRNNGIAGKIHTVEKEKVSLSKNLVSLKAKAPLLQVEEATKDYATVLTVSYSSYDEAANEYKTSSKSLTQLLSTATKFEASKKEVSAIDAKIDALLSDEEYTVRILKTVTDAKEAVRLADH